VDGLPSAAVEGTSESAALKGKRLTLGPNGFAFIPVENAMPATVKFGGRRKVGA